MSVEGLQVVPLNDDQMAFSRLLADIKAIINEARSAAYAGINAIQIDHNWKIGKRIVEEEQGGRVRAEYGKRTITELSAHLCAEFGEGYSERNLRDFRAFYVVFPDSEIWHTRVPNLSWSHFRAIMRVADPIAREWYINEASNEHWGVRTLDRNISTQYYERLLLSQADKLPVIAEMKRKTAAFQKDKLEFIKNPSVLMLVNSEQTLLYWDIGHDILEKQDSEGWGTKVVERMSADLKAAFPDMKGWSRSNLMYMRQFADAWTRKEIVQAPLGQLPWYHHLALLECLKSRGDRIAYAALAILNKPIGVSTYRLGLPPIEQLQAQLRKVLTAPSRKGKSK